MSMKLTENQQQITTDNHEMARNSDNFWIVDDENRLIDISMVQLLNDVMSHKNLSNEVVFQQSMTSMLLNILGFCCCMSDYEQELIVAYQSALKFILENPQAAYQLLLSSFAPNSSEMDKQTPIYPSGFTFPNFSQENQNPLNLLNPKPYCENKNESTKSKNLSEKDNGREEKSSSEDDKQSDDSDDDSILKSHPYEIMYILNKRTHRKLKRMVCKHDGCNKIFEKKWNFKDHIRMHNGETPYQCSECHKSFTQKGNLVKHERQHKFKSLKSRKIHKCTICTKCFTEKYNLKSHMKTHHGQ